MLLSSDARLWLRAATALLLFLAEGSAMLPEGNNWCSAAFQCRGEGGFVEHTMCTYGPKAPAGRCRELRDVQTDEKRKAIVESLNAARLVLTLGKVAGWPTAADMREISYDYELELIAHRWAAQCADGADKCRRTREWQRVGQIVADKVSDSPINADSYAPRAEIRGWFMESAAADPSARNLLVPNEKTARFTQLIWADTHRVGCADVTYQTGDKEVKYHRKLVCNFGPGGNVPGGRIYSSGPICSECEIGVKCLCGGAIPLHQESTAAEAGATEAAGGDGATGAEGAGGSGAGSGSGDGSGAAGGGGDTMKPEMVEATGFMFQTEDATSGIDLSGGLDDKLQPAKPFDFENEGRQEASTTPAAATTTPKGGVAPEGSGGNETESTTSGEVVRTLSAATSAMLPILLFIV